MSYLPYRVVSTTGRSREDVVREYINTSVYLESQDSEYSGHSKFSRYEDFDEFLIPDDINIRFGGFWDTYTPIEYILLLALTNYSYKNKPRTPIGMKASGLKGVYLLIDLFIKRGAKFSYDRARLYKGISYMEPLASMKEFEPVLTEIDNHYRSADSATASVPTGSSAASVRRGGRRRSTRRNRRSTRRNRSRKH